VAGGVAGGQGLEIERGGGFWPAKPKSECGALGIDLAFKSRAGGVVQMCRVRWMWQLEWREARGKKSCRGGGICLRNRKPSATHSVLIWCSNRERGEWWKCVG